ncbi:MAG: RidA family protein [Gammaproteobacteria bacterium]|nr:RidA family protein [Gammaproteobacteria bacterium]
MPLSKAVRAGDFVFLSGQLGLTATGQLAGDDIVQQTHQCMENIRALLTQAGCGMSDVIKATVWLVERADFGAFNRVYATYFLERPPVRSTVISELVLAGARVEIEVAAYAP